MSEQRYPFFVEIYKGEGRLLIIPLVDHFGGYRVESVQYFKMEYMESCTILGKRISEAIDVIANSKVSYVTPKEREKNAVWRKNSKYKSWTSFWKNNYYASFKIFEDKHYQVYSARRSEQHKGVYSNCIKIIELPSTATVEEIGEAVIEVFKAAEEYYAEKPVCDSYPAKDLELMDGSKLEVKPPRDDHFADREDGGAAEIYQCYSYLTQEGMESSADFFIGIAPELDCCLEAGHVRDSWEEVYGKAESFDIQEVECGIFKLRVEMKNKATHKISYFLQMEEDLILECGMDVHQPNRRKKLDEKLAVMFGEFVSGCKLNCSRE